MGYTKQTITGFSWQGILLGLTMVITTLKLMVLTRLLDQHDFGIFSLVAIVLGLSEAVTARLRDAAARAATDERVVKAISGAGTPIQFLDSAGFASFVRDDARVMGDVVRRIGKQ